MAWASGATLLPVGPGSTDQLIGWLRDLPITAMSATPSFLRYLVERIERDQIDASAWTLRLGLIGGEPASAALRAHVVERLGDGFVWQELYGSTEVGGPVLGWSPPQDPLGGRLLVDTDEFVVELLHPDRDEPVAAGDIGELTVTTPYRELAPLIRYRTRDLTTALDVTDPSGYPSVSSIVGRVDDALKVRGALVYPGAIEHIVVSHCSPGTEWRVVVDRDPGALDVLTVVVEHEELDAAGLGDLLAAGIGVRCDVEVVDPKSLDRFEGKSRRVIDRRPG
jgi:phenylacetate-CoA ligase